MARITASLRPYLEHYGASHRNRVNRALHYVGIPLFMVATMGLLARLALGGDELLALRPNLAWVILAGMGIFYLRLDWKIGLPTWAGFVACYVIGCFLPVPTLWALAGLGVVLHGVGHYAFEHKPPALFSKPIAIFEAPPWLLAIWAGLLR